jgi:ubiquinone/menaquinone biosynthesis C-methylase UbiE
MMQFEEDDLASNLVIARGLPVSTELVTFENRQKKRLVGFHDFSPSSGRDKNWIIVLPGFGETKTDVLTTSYFLAKNGFDTLRFDYSDHVGESDGDIVFTSLVKIKEDILSSVDFIFDRYCPAGLAVVGSSLACRPLFRAAREDSRIGLAVNLVSVVDLRKTLFEIYRHDHFGDAHRGHIKGNMDILGLQVNADNFLTSSIRDRFEDLSTTIEDVRGIKNPVVFFAAEKDAWVDLEDVRCVYCEIASREKHLIVLEGAMHRLYENPEVARAALKGIVNACVKYLSKAQGDIHVEQPNLREIGKRIRKEKERNRNLHNLTKNDEIEFWKSFLERYDFAIKVNEYWNLMDFIYRLLGQPALGEKILDAGCGTGNYGTFLIMKSSYKLRQNIMDFASSSWHYVGVDFVNEAIVHAKQLHRAFQQEFTLKQDPLFSYLTADLESKLPFRDNSFDKICCNMVVSYLQNVNSTMAEMIRILKAGGRIVLTSLKPFADLSEMYRKFVDTTTTVEENRNALELLNNISRINVKETEGIYRFCSEEELTDLLSAGGASEIETYRTFGNQVNVALGTKV